LTLVLVSFAVAEDFTDTPFRWPDMLRNGGRVVQILTSESNPRPVDWNYPAWYSKYPMRFVEDVPVPPGGEVAGGELVVLEYDITDKMGYGSDSLKTMAKGFGAMGSMMMNKFSPKHNELGLIAKDKTGKELGRFVFSLWPIGNDEIVDLNKDMRQRPREYNNTLITKNRAVTSVELSKANTWWGLPSDTKQVHVSNLNRAGFFKTIQAVKDYAAGHQWFNDYEITMPDGKVKMPAVTCNSLIEHVIESASHQRAFDDGLGKMGYLALSVDKKKAQKFGTVATKHIHALMKSKSWGAHYNKDMYVVPAYYDEDGKPRASSAKEAPEEWYVVWTSGVNWRQNYIKAEEFQLKAGFKVGEAAGMNLRQIPKEFDSAPAAPAPEKKPEGKNLLKNAHKGKGKGKNHKKR